MRRKIILTAIILFAGLSFGGIVRFLEQKGDIDFSLDAIAIYSISDNKQKLRIYWEIPRRELLFTRADSGYSAYFEVTIIAYDEGDNQVAGDCWRRSYSVPSYEATLLASESFIDSLDFSLPEGRYKTKVVIRDLHSANQGVGIVEISVPRIQTDSVSLSELVFVKDGVPAFEDDFGLQDKVAVLCEIYNLLLLRGYTLKAVMSGADIERVFGDRPVQPDSFKREEWELGFSQLTKGDYQFSVSLVSEDGKITDEKSKDFHIEISPFGDDGFFTEMVNQLQYIATVEEMRRLKEASVEEREDAWNAFWKEKDPTPSTETNEFKEEYYRRIDYANTYYGGLQKGWRTDRGKTYIIHGPPDEVERHPYELDSMPYEIWYYYGSGLRLIFVDEHGIGEYRLFSPRGERW